MEEGFAFLPFIVRVAQTVIAEKKVGNCTPCSSSSQIQLPEKLRDSVMLFLDEGKNMIKERAELGGRL